MAKSILASVHTSSIFPVSQASDVSIDTARSDVPIPEVDPDVLPEHASFSSTFSSAATGTILLRVIHGGLILELIPLATGRPTRFSFPAPILPSPTILLHQLSELRIFVVTTSGSLFTLTFPVEDDLPFFEVTPPARLWCNEYLITVPAEDFEGPVYVKDIDCVLIGLSKGRFLRLDSGLDYSRWHESLHRIKTTWTSYLVSDSDESQIVSFASHPPPTDSILIFSLSRDRTLRAWNHGTCVASYPIRHTARTSLSPIPQEEMSAAEPKGPLLNPKLCTLIRVLPVPDNDLQVDESLQVLVFLPTSASFESGGWFHLFRVLTSRTVSKEIYHVRSIPCSPRTAGAELRDFMVYSSSLYALWDKQGRPIVEYTHFDPDLQDEIDPSETWHCATYRSEAELTPDYLDELLLQSGGGSLVDVFMTAILRPGVFSRFTIETALRQYTDSLLSLPGPHPGPFRQSYVTLGEHIAAVVGCTVDITVDPRSGVPQRANYWNALKRDWEGFVARCREIERSGRWPLSLGLDGRERVVLILERERAGYVTSPDQPLAVQCGLNNEDAVGKYPVLEIGTAIRRRLSSAEIHIYEAHFETLVSQECGYSYAETLAHCFSSVDDRQSDMIDLARSGLDGVDLPVEFERALDVIISLQTDVKTEEVEEIDEGPEVPQSTQWARGVATAYVFASIEARYELCLTLVVLLFHLDYCLDFPPALLARIFATFRNVVIARFLAWQPAGDPDGTQTTGPQDQDSAILRGLQNMAVSSRHTAPERLASTTYSLIHRIMVESNSTEAPLPEAALANLRHLGFFESRDAAEVTMREAALCKWLVDLGFRDAALEIIGRLPRSPAISYVHGLLLLQIGRPEEGAPLLQRVGAFFGPATVLSAEEDRALRFVTQNTGSSSEHSYYKWIATMFEKAGYHPESVRFYNLAIEFATPEEDTSDLWRKVITGYTELDMFEDAYMALVTAPYESIKREAVSQLVQAMCEGNAVDRLMSLNFVGLPNEVENALSFKVRNADPLSRPLYPQVLYAWYVFRGDFRNAAATMYQFARRLSAHMGSPDQYLTILELQEQAYLVALNALSLIDPKSAWISVPVTPETFAQGNDRKRRKLSKHIPEDKYSPGCRDVEVVDLTDMRHEYTLVSSRLELIKQKPALLAASQYVLSGAQIVSAYAQAGRYDYAMSAARSLDVDMTELFARLTMQCLRLTRRGEAALEDDTADWLHTERVAAWPGGAAERGWRYLRASLEQHDKAENGHAYRKAVAEKLLEFADPRTRTGALPSWLVGFFQAHEPEYLIRTYLRYDLIGDAIGQSVALVKKVDVRVARPRAAASTWLPYGLFDMVIAAAETSNTLTPAEHNQLGELRSEVAARVRRMQKWSEAQ